jgi:putative two-component system response regulator
MSRTCALIARELRFGVRDRANLRIASAMHDIGKIGIPDAVLLKPAALDASERAIIERHPEIGYQILAGPRDPTMRLAATIALTHHERVDGCGYPRGLCGDEIPLAGRIAAVADVFDALTHDRVYRPAMAVDSAVSILRDGRGTQFDACVVDAFERVLSEVVALQRRYPNPAGHRPGTRYRAHVARGRSASTPGGAR